MATAAWSSCALGRLVARVVPGPFEHYLGMAALFAIPTNLAKAEQLLPIRRDLLAAVAELAREVVFWQTDLVLGECQGGLVALAYSRRLFLEAALQARNLQRDEAHRIAEGWGAARGCRVCTPR